jgi:hypothetical protein
VETPRRESGCSRFSRRAVEQDSRSAGVRGEWAPCPGSPPLPHEAHLRSYRPRGHRIWNGEARSCAARFRAAALDHQPRLRRLPDGQGHGDVSELLSDDRRAAGARGAVPQAAGRHPAHDLQELRRRHRRAVQGHGRLRPLRPGLVHHRPRSAIPSCACSPWSTRTARSASPGS